MIIKVFGIFAYVILILVISFLVPLPIFSNTDFSVLYYSNQALLNGIHLYDYQNQLEFLQTTIHPDITFHPYPYPPWYALSTIFLAFLPIDVAARVWFLFNLTMIAISIWLMTFHWKMQPRIFALLGASIFFPVLGLLVVGQYSAPVLLGVALLLWAIRKESSLAVSLAFVLLTFKPHIGLVIAVIMFGWLIFHQNKPFARRAMIMILGFAVFLFSIGFIADPVWPLNYLKSLGHYRDISGVQSCGLCASLPVMIVELISGDRNVFQGAVVSLFLAIGLTGIFVLRFGTRLQNDTLLLGLATIFTLLVDPYLLSYDFILLLILLVILVDIERSKIGKLVMRLAYFLPWAILLLGRDGNFLYLVSTFLLLVLIWNSSQYFQVTNN